MRERRRTLFCRCRAAGGGPKPGRAPLCAAIPVPGESGQPDRALSALPRTLGAFPQRRRFARAGREIFPDAGLHGSAGLSQIAWFDEFFLEDPDIAELVRKERELLARRSAFVIAQERELLAQVLPAHADAARRKDRSSFPRPRSTIRFCLCCAIPMWARVSSPGLPLAAEPLSSSRGCARPNPSRPRLARKGLRNSAEGRLALGGQCFRRGNLAIAHDLGVQWMATDEGVLGRTHRTISLRAMARVVCRATWRESLYTIYRYENGPTEMHLVFRDHTHLRSDRLCLFGHARQRRRTAPHHNIQRAAQPVLDRGAGRGCVDHSRWRKCLGILPKSGREFLRRFYEALQTDARIEAVTISEAIARHRNFGQLALDRPGLMDLRQLQRLDRSARKTIARGIICYHARNFYDETAPQCTEAQRKLAYEELLIAEGSDWNWWYGPEHHSANDRDFDELYRKHLSNVYQALGAAPPDHLAQPISGDRCPAIFYTADGLHPSRALRAT